MLPPPLGQRLMRCLDLTLPTAADNLALDEALLIAAEEGKGGEVLRFWELPTLAVVLGSGGSLAIDVNLLACAEAHIPILRRSSGGGTVLLGPGCLCYSLILAYGRAPGLEQIPLSNQYVLGRVRRALQSIAPAATIEGTSDLVLAPQGDRSSDMAIPAPVKFSGNAQQRKRRFFLHHGTLLCGFDLSLIPQFLNAPERQPSYRHNRSHTDFVANLNADAAEIKAFLRDEWQAEEDDGPIAWDAVAQLVAEKYSRDDWNRRR